MSKVYTIISGHLTSLALTILSNISLAYAPMAVHTLSLVDAVVQVKKEATIFKRTRKRITNFTRS